MATKQKYKCLSLSEKKEVIAAVESGKAKSEVAKTFQIPASTLSTIIKNKQKIVEVSSVAGRKRTTKGEYPRLEECLVTWLRQCRDKNVPVGGSLLKEKAKAYAKELGIPSFAASGGWLTNFKKRNGIFFKKVCGESASVSDSVCSDWRAELSRLTESYEPHNIFNTDETGLFFKCMPDKTITFKDEKCHGGKHSKERLTLLVTVNMDGSEKLKPLLIGKAAKPRCFKGIQSFPVTYRSNKKAWMTTELFNEWLNSLNSDMKKQNREILLFFDNCSVHNNPPNLSNVKLHFFPPNTTSKLQPLDQGIIQNFKAFYRHEIVKIVLDGIDSNATPNISILTAMLIIEKAWKSVSQTTIFNCFRKSGFCVNTPDEELQVVQPTPWESHPVIGDVPFEDFVQVDDEVVVWGTLTDADILAAKDEEQPDVDNDEEDQEFPPVTLKEASTSLKSAVCLV
ncbi:tigger transposable element-derived protein 6-like [Homalodisca vitripennis]|uniref:tigger transposable element-derived protein 6-like n=1 Tax=Homalodisca vitripennis TaxID=197043 RepID=UPI001EEB25FC|nr:tigger transposable element-derived protein 6-like [Homalodisca vitripennis]